MPKPCYLPAGPLAHVILQIHLRVLVERDSTTPAQASIARFSQACTILHELTHAIWRVRREEFQLNVYPEAYMGEEQIRELGMSFISHVFGGTMQGMLLPVAVPGQVAGQKFTITDRPLEVVDLFASYGQRPRDGWEALRYGRGSDPQMIIPPFICSTFFEQSYWDRAVSAKGTIALQPGRLLAWDGTVQSVPQVDEFRGSLDKVAGAMNARRLEVRGRHLRRNKNRARHINMWSKSLWSHVALRKDLSSFREFHSRQRLGPCRGVADGLLNSARGGLARIRASEDRDRNAEGACWVAIGIAYL